MAEQQTIRDVPPPEPEPELEGDASDLDSSRLFNNRELSWIEFNARVLELAEQDDMPLMERLKFLAIFTSNLDEFFTIRVAGLHDQVDAGLHDPGPDGRTPSQVIDELRERILELNERQTRCSQDEVRPALAEHNICIVGMDEVGPEEREALNERFRRQIFPVLTPLAVGLGRPFPYISNLSLSLAVLVRDPQTQVTTFARVKVPKEMLPRFVPAGEGTTFVPLENLIAKHLNSLFPGMEIVDHGFFRVTRDADFDISDEADDLLRAVEQELRRRRFGEVVRVEVGAGMSRRLGGPLVHALDIDEGELFEVDGMLDLKDLFGITRVHGSADLRYEPWP